MNIEQQVALIKQSSWFDEQWYLQQYPDVARIKMCAATHFVRYGWKVGRNPSVKFHTRRYLERYDDVARSGTNPLVHYLQHGHKERRAATPVTEPAGSSVIKKGRLSRPPITPAGQLAVTTPTPVAMPEDSVQRIALQLEQTQQLLEHYFKRCQELEQRLT